MNRWKFVLAIAALLLLLWCGHVAWDYFDPNSPANLAMQIQLKMFGSAIYEFHSHTGHWPTKVEDLSATSLPAQSYVWRKTANSIVFLWPQNLDSDPKNNSDVLLAYWKGGLFNRFGSVWVCRGDLSTRRVKKSKILLTQ